MRRQVWLTVGRVTADARSVIEANSGSIKQVYDTPQIMLVHLPEVELTRGGDASVSYEFENNNRLFIPPFFSANEAVLYREDDSEFDQKL